MIEELLKEVKELVDLEEDDTTYDKKLTHAINLALLEIKSYCNLSEVPYDLYPLIVEVISQEHKNLTSPTLSKLKEGEVSYEFKTQEIRSRILEFKYILDSYTTL